MPDNKKKIEKPDRTRINVNEPYELRRWAKDLEVTQVELKSVVRKVGPMVKDVKKAIRK